MSSHALTNFTLKPGSFFDGVSKMTSIGRCDPISFSVVDESEQSLTDCWIRFPIADSGGAVAFFDVCMPVGGDDFSLSETDTYRLLCHAMVQGLPEAAFGEAIESLVGMYDFYRDSNAIPALPVPLNAARAKITGSYVSPVFPVLEE
jgi:hypothetical protein